MDLHFPPALKRRLKNAVGSKLAWATLLSILLLPALLLFFFQKMVFGNLILARGDTFLYFYPYWQAAADALQAGRIPLWNPHLFMGAPFIANSQVGAFYPLNWPLWFLLETPYAVSASIVLHLAIAAWGMYRLARARLQLSPAGACLAAVLFSLGGYLTAQVEHVNQLQGLAWLPWLLLVCDPLAPSRTWRARGRTILGLGLLFALQLTAGHTQTLFISAVGVLLWSAGRALAPASNLTGGWRDLLKPVLIVPGLGLLGATALAAVQLLPTLQLVQHSSRQGGLGLNEAVSFSLHPLLLAHSLLPGYGESVFTEYVAFLPLTALLLALMGAWRWRRSAAASGGLALAAGGLLLALGRFNPLYLLLATLPGFSYFRAPARWLVLYALGAALLAGLGVDVVTRVRASGEQRPLRLSPLKVGMGLLLLLIALRFLAVPLADLIPVGSEVAMTWPTWSSVAGWLVELGLALILLAGYAWPSSGRDSRRLRRLALLVVAVGVLFLGSRTLPYNNPTAPAAYFDLRPPIARLQAMQSCSLLPQQCRQPPGRLLSLSDIFFDLGDQAEIESVYGDQISREALDDYVVALKQKAIVAPNLPLAYGLSSVDGFDGGLLPLQDYSTLAQLVLPDGVTTSDGRLREHLDSVPDDRWLDLFDARYVITDKVGDVWMREVFFDRQHPDSLAPGEAIVVGDVPDYEATELWLLAPNGDGRVLIEVDDEVSAERWELIPEQLDGELWRVTFPEPAVPRSISLVAQDAPWQVQGLALVDSRDGTFRQLVPGAYRLLHSGDVKIYENLDVLPRAFLVHGWRWAPDVQTSVSLMAEAGFDPRETAILTGDGAAVESVGQPSGQAEIVVYALEQVTIQTSSDAPGLLLLADAYYPGWTATVDGEQVALYRADGLFRGVMVPEGQHDVRFTFRSRPFEWGRVVSLVAIGLWLVLFAVASRRGRDTAGDG